MNKFRFFTIILTLLYAHQCMLNAMDAEAVSHDAVRGTSAAAAGAAPRPFMRSSDMRVAHAAGSPDAAADYGSRVEPSVETVAFGAQPETVEQHIAKHQKDFTDAQTKQAKQLIETVSFDKRKAVVDTAKEGPDASLLVGARKVFAKIGLTSIAGDVGVAAKAAEEGTLFSDSPDAKDTAAFRKLSTADQLQVLQRAIDAAEEASAQETKQAEATITEKSKSQKIEERTEASGVRANLAKRSQALQDKIQKMVEQANELMTVGGAQKPPITVAVEKDPATGKYRVVQALKPPEGAADDTLVGTFNKHSQMLSEAEARSLAESIENVATNNRGEVIKTVARQAKGWFGRLFNRAKYKDVTTAVENGTLFNGSPDTAAEEKFKALPRADKIAYVKEAIEKAIEESKAEDKKAASEEKQRQSNITATTKMLENNTKQLAELKTKFVLKMADNDATIIATLKSIRSSDASPETLFQKHKLPDLPQDPNTWTAQQFKDYAQNLTDACQDQRFQAQVQDTQALQKLLTDLTTLAKDISTTAQTETQLSTQKTALTKESQNYINETTASPQRLQAKIKEIIARANDMAEGTDAPLNIDFTFKSPDKYTLLEPSKNTAELPKPTMKTTPRATSAPQASVTAAGRGANTAAAAASTGSAATAAVAARPTAPVAAAPEDAATPPPAKTVMLGARPVPTALAYADDDDAAAVGAAGHAEDVDPYAAAAAAWSSPSAPPTAAAGSVTGFIASADDAAAAEPTDASGWGFDAAGSAKSGITLLGEKPSWLTADTE